jgi:hypothetical protein
MPTAAEVDALLDAAEAPQPVRYPFRVPPG